jgi:hypothetical protein
MSVTCHHTEFYTTSYIKWRLSTSNKNSHSNIFGDVSKMFVSTQYVVKFAVKSISMISPTHNDYLVLNIFCEYRATKYQVSVSLHERLN